MIQIECMKKIFIILFTLISFNALAVDKSTTFSNEVFAKAQAEGKTVVINSWNKTCYTCGRQVKILNEAEKEFTNILFLSFEQTKDKEIAKLLGIEYWTTIVVYKDNKAISRTIGKTKKTEIYSQIKSL